LKNLPTVKSVDMPFLAKEVMMELKQYFENTKGVGVLATADADGKVDAAIYARPHFMEDGTLAIIMRDRLTHHNLQSNPHATFLFIEDGPGYKGKRLFMTKVREEKDSELLYSLRRRQYPDDKGEAKFLVFFKLDKELPLVGAGK
jgi:molybdopterin-guanine dinucleotide biosynthesis protein A